jgi:hypothetical protein
VAVDWCHDLRMAQPDDDEWVSLGVAPWWMPVIGMSPGPLLMAWIPLFVLQLSSIFDVPITWSVVLTVGSGAACFGLAYGIGRLIYPRAFLNPATSTLRAGRKQAQYRQITSANLVVSSSRKHRSLTLVLRTDNKLRGAVLLRDTHQNTLTPEVVRLVGDLLHQSNIAMPVSQDDPKGRFAHFNFPGYLTKEEALELVAHPPAPADALPASLGF